MARFTPDPGEIQHLQEIEHQLGTLALQHRWRLKVVLVTGKVVVGWADENARQRAAIVGGG